MSRLWMSWHSLAFSKRGEDSLWLHCHDFGDLRDLVLTPNKDRGSTSVSGLRELDRVAGDHKYVFFAYGKPFLQRAMIDVSFGFDTQRLIKKGAGFREIDLLGDYMEALEEARPSRGNLSKTQIRMIVRSVADGGTTFGAAALSEAERLSNEIDADSSEAEIVFPGAVPLRSASKVLISRGYDGVEYDLADGLRELELMCRKTRRRKATTRRS